MKRGQRVVLTASGIRAFSGRRTPLKSHWGTVTADQRQTSVVKVRPDGRKAERYYAVEYWRQPTEEEAQHSLASALSSYNMANDIVPGSKDYADKT